MYVQVNSVFFAISMVNKVLFLRGQLVLNLLVKSGVLYYLATYHIIDKARRGIKVKISLSEVEYVARLARIRLNEEEKIRFLKELNSILDYMDLLSEVDTTDVSPTTHTQHITNALRKDIKRASQPLKDALANAPAKADDAFIVPGIIE